MKKAWHQNSETETLLAHKTDIEKGLSDTQVAALALKHGDNKLHNFKRKTAFRMLLSQFADLLVIILIVAAIISAFLGEPEDTIAIIAIVILNALLGFIQEYRAERSMEALKALSTPVAKVKRKGQFVEIPTYQIVPGDIVTIEAGQFIPADLRILKSTQLGVDESSLTGESNTINKISEAIPHESLPIADQKNMAFKGTMVTSGNAIGIVVSTGMNTELGKIANLLKVEVEVNTPLQNKMARFAKMLTIVVIGICIVVFATGFFRGEDPVLMFMTALSLAVAGIPEALPAVITVTLALGARAMGRSNSLVRKLPAVESLGAVTYICTDKTGTLTQNRMEVQTFSLDGKTLCTIPEVVTPNTSWDYILKNLALNNDVSFDENQKALGEPTEIALAQAAKEVDFDRLNIEKELPRIAELPFSSDRRMMTTIHKSKTRHLILSKGAPEKIFPLCKTWLNNDKSETFSADSQVSAIENMAAKGYRILALAYKELPSSITEVSIEHAETDLVFLGLVALMDPPRSEAKEAVRLSKSAGINVVMITGDHPATAMSIAKDLNIITADTDLIMTGQELLKISDIELKKIIHNIKVFARVAPEQKIYIVKALQSIGEIVAMTGDGVNDAPALRSADVGVSMGKGGTDVAREASHIILLDDNFATIVLAIKEGRRIYDNIRKFIRFALSGNSGEILTLFLAPFLGLPIPLLPIHILWINLVTDGFPGIALGTEPAEKNIMQRPPRSPKESIFARGLWQHTVWVGFLTAGLTLAIVAWAKNQGLEHWQTMGFTVLTFTQLGHVMAIRSESLSIFTLGFRTNKALWITVLMTFIVHLAVLYLPVMNKVFKTSPLSFFELGLCIVVSSAVFICVEIEKWYQRNKN